MTSDLIAPFLLTLAVSFLIGIGLREYYESEKKFDTFGTVRTFIFIGILGFVLFQIPDLGREVYLAGFGSLAVFLAIYYANKLQEKKGPGLIGVLIGLLTYAMGPMALGAPAWFPLLIAISTLFVLHSKGRIREFTDRLQTGEVVTACKFIAIAGVVLPLMPDRTVDLGGFAGRILSALPVTPRQIWLAVVITTAVSYLGYLLHTYIVRRGGLVLTGVVGGLCSSTAAVLVLARQSRTSPDLAEEAAVAIVMAVSMMYMRLLILVAVFRVQTVTLLGPALLALSAAAAVYSFALRRRLGPTLDSATPNGASTAKPAAPGHPLELDAALFFGTMFAATAWATKFVLAEFQDFGLRMLSFAVGFSDITPFVVSVLQGNLGIGDAKVAQAILIASASNNLLKAAYTFIAGARRTAALATPALVGLALFSGGYALLGF